MITVNFEAYHDDMYNIRKMGVEAFCLDKRMEILLVAVRLDKDEEIMTMSCREFQRFLEGIDEKKTIVVAYDTVLTGTVLMYDFGFIPRVFIDVQTMGRIQFPRSGWAHLIDLAKLCGTDTLYFPPYHTLSGISLRDLDKEKMNHLKVHSVNFIDCLSKVFNFLKNRISKDRLKELNDDVQVILKEILAKRGDA